MTSDTSREGVIQSPPGGGERKRVGRPPLEFSDKDRDRVKKMSAYGLKHDVIADIIGCDSDSLRKHFALELKIGLGEIIEQVADSLIEKAKSERPDAVNAAKFFLQSRGDWAEKTEDVTEERHEDRLERRKAAVARAKERGDGSGGFE